VLAVLELHVREAVAVGGTVTLDGVMALQVKPAGTVSVRLTVPLKDPTVVTVIVDVADVPTTTEAGEVAVIMKSETWKVKVAVVE
jgi:hypothetical protein